MSYLYFSIHGVCILILMSFNWLPTRAQDPCPPCEKSNVTYLCRSLPTLQAKVRLCYYNTTPNATLDVVFSVAPPSADGWVAWGLNPIRPQMVDAQVLIAYRNSNRSVTVSPVTLTFDTKHGCGVRTTGFEAKVYRSNGSYYEDSKMMVISARLGLPQWCNFTRLSHVWQVGPQMHDGSPVKHQRTLQNFDSRETIDLSNNGHVLGHNHGNLRKAHGILGMIGWGFLLPCGMIASRYFKEYPFPCVFWFGAHVGFQIGAYTIGTVGWSIGLALQSDHFWTFRAHRVIGIIIFGLATLQMLAIFLKPTKVDRYRRYWNIYHHFVGYSLLSLIVINIFKGLAILRPPKIWRHAYISVLISLASVAALLEIATWFKFLYRRNSSKKDSSSAIDHPTNPPGTTGKPPATTTADDHPTDPSVTAGKPPATTAADDHPTDPPGAAGKPPATAAADDHPTDPPEIIPDQRTAKLLNP